MCAGPVASWPAAVMTEVISDVSSQSLRFGLGVRVLRLGRRLTRRIVVSSAMLFAVGLLFSAIAHADVYWANYGSGGGGIGHASSDGTGVNQNFISAPDSDGAGPFKVAVGDGYIFWVDLQAGTIGRANINGTGVNQDFVTTGGNNDLYGLAVGGNYLYFAYFAGIAGTGTGTSIGRVNIDGSGLNDDFIPLDTGVTPYGIAVNANYIYWEEEEYQGPNLEETIARANINGSGVDNDFISDGGTQGGVAVNADYIYYSLGNDIGRANLDGSDPDSDFITTSGEEDVAVDSNYIYWASDGSSIGRANLDGTDVDDSFITGGHQTSGVAGGGAASYEISGETYQANCSNTVCAMPTPVPDTTVSVKSLDGGSVNTSDVTDDDGDWSVVVPAGDYLVTPEGSDDWEPPNRDITVNSDTSDVDFSQCTSDSGSGTDLSGEGAMSRPTVWGQIASSASNPCQRLYTIQVGAWIPEQSVVDPYVGATNADGTGYPVNARGFTSLTDSYPPCLSPTVSKLYAETRPDMRWLSKFLGSGSPTPVSPGWGSVTVPISWNGITGASEVRNITTTPGKLTRQYDYETQLASGTSHGTCGVPREMDPLVRATILSSSTNDDTGTSTATFELDISWPIPFKPFEDLADVKDFNDAILAPFTKQAQADLEKKIEQLPGYSSLPPLAKSKLKTWGVAIAKELGAKGAIELVESALKKGSGYLLNLTPPPIKLGKKAIDILKKLAYGAADARITGTFLTHFGAIDYTTLTLETSTDGFPSIYVDVYRPTGLVPWESTQSIFVTKTGYGGAYSSLSYVVNDANTETGTTDQLRGGGYAKERVERNLSILANGVPSALRAFEPPIIVGTDSLKKTISWEFIQQDS